MTVKPSPGSKQKAVRRKQPVNIAVQQNSSDESNYEDVHGSWNDSDTPSSSSGNDDSDDEDYQP
jgi:hypothetical protein